MRIVVVGSGMAGTILARILVRSGHAVTLVERGTHPRFAIGESSTPLAALALERLAARWDLEDLRTLAAWGRWRRDLPELGRGLKRGFTFYGHEPGQPFRNGPDDPRRLLVAASPDDEVSDAHWLRADTDAWLLERARESGAEYLDRTELDPVTGGGPPFRLTGTRDGRAVDLTADFVVGATGAGTLPGLPRGGDEPGTPSRLRTGAVFGHFADVRRFPASTGLPDADLPPGPYPDDRAAVHHLLEEGWMYQLRFDHEVVSAGFVVEHGAAGFDVSDREPGAAFRDILGRYPALRDQFADARVVVPLRTVPRLQRRQARAAGPGWARLPHAFAFTSPMFSPGMAWSVLGVERLALALAGGAGPALDERLARYEELLRTEADFIDRMLANAYAVRTRFDAFVGYSFAYFVAATFQEARQRLIDPAGGPDAWSDEGFLGATDPVTRLVVEELETWARRAAADPAGPDHAAKADLRRILAPRNLAGLADEARGRRYPVVLEDLVEGHDLLGLTRREVEVRLSRLRGGPDGE